MKDKKEIINDIEAFALDMTMRLENLESFDDTKSDYWFFYHMLTAFEQMITDVHQYEMLNK